MWQEWRIEDGQREVLGGRQEVAREEEAVRWRDEMSFRVGPQRTDRILWNQVVNNNFAS